jgi:hypothetical protein
MLGPMQPRNWTLTPSHRMRAMKVDAGMASACLDEAHGVNWPPPRPSVTLNPPPSGAAGPLSHRKGIGMSSCHLEKALSPPTGFPTRRRRPIRLWLALLAIALPAAFPAHAFDGSLREPLARSLVSQSADVHRRRDSGRQLPLRSYSNAALAALAIDQNAGKAAQLLEVAFLAQDQASGDFPWLQPGERQIQDRNAVEFVTQAWGPLLLGFADRLPAETRDTLARHARNALPALARHNPPVSYTNIYLMNALNTLLIGQAVGDAGAAQNGRRKLEAWRDEVRRNGLREFSSPTYYATNLNSLVAGYLYAKDAADRRLIKGLLDFLWSDIAAHTVDGKLTGPHSRDYDAVFGEGNLNVYLAAEGLRPMENPRQVSIEMIYAILNMGDGGYRPAPDILALAKLPQRTVLARWGNAPAQTRTLHVDGRAAIGSVAGGAFGNTDKLFTIDLRRGPARSLTIGFIPSTSDNPFSERRQNEEGRNIFRHPPGNVGMVQHGGWVLGSYDINPSRERGAMRFTTSLLLPRDADELLLDGKPFRGQPIEARNGSTVTLRVGESCTAIRIVRADSSAPPTLTTTGSEQIPEVVRLVIPQASDSLRSQIVFLARAGRCDGGAERWARPVIDAPVQDVREGTTWTLGATVEGHQIGLRRDLNNRRVLSMVGGDQVAQGSVLSINGTSLLQGLAPQ